VDELLPIARRMTQINTGKPAPDDVPILGANDYRLTLPFFEQKAGCAMDLPPQRIGGGYSYRITPVASNGRVIAGRLQEVLGIPAETIAPEPLDTMHPSDATRHAGRTSHRVRPARSPAGLVCARLRDGWATGT
jgi:hypothetical protein